METGNTAERRTPGLVPGGAAPLSGGPAGRLVSVFGYLGVSTLLVAIALTCGDIVWRRAVGGAFVDTFDITKLCLVAAASWSIPYGFVHGTHVTVDLLVERFPASAQRLLDAGIHGAAAALLALLAWLSWQGLMLHHAYGDTTLNLRLPIVLYRAIFLFGLGLAVVACLLRVADALRSGRRSGGPIA